MIRNISLVSIVFLSNFFLSGCGENQSQQQVLRDAEQYNIKSYADRNVDNSPASHKLSVNSPQESLDPVNQNSMEKNSINNKQLPTMQINKSKKYSAILKTSEGDITIELEVKKTPITANNFVALAKENFYNGLVFHRVVKEFMIQGGDPKGDGSGGPGYEFADENLEGEYARGTVAMANSGPNTNGSQFFIMHKDYDLPNKYVIFGHVSSGLDVIDKIASAEVTISGAGENSKPMNPVKINSVEIVEE